MGIPKAAKNSCEEKLDGQRRGLRKVFGLLISLKRSHRAGNIGQ
jgi:hypothetical protein